jgi:hypothetical protein
MTPSFATRTAGVGLRLPHLAKVLETKPAAAWFEVHPENVIANPHAAELLCEIAALYPISLHSVGISVGSAGGLDRAHLARIKTLADRIDPILFSGHLAWSTHQGEYLNDLLPLPYHRQSLTIVCDHIAAVQDALGRTYHLENPSNYLGFTDSTMTETQFLAEVVHRTGCRLLCDVSNIHVSAHNLGYDARRYLDDLPGEAIGEFHLGGFEIEAEEGGTTVIIDTHAQPIAAEAWDLYAYAVSRFGRRPTLIEWDSAIPDLDVLLREAALADSTAEAAMKEKAHALPV